MKHQKFTALEGFIFIAIGISYIAQIFSAQISLGLVWAILFGLMFGSYSTSFIARMPKGIMRKKEDAYCMSCKHPLERRDLYTIFSYVINRGKCRFCDAAIPKAIFFTETTVTIGYIVAYLQYGFSMYFIIVSFCVFLTTIIVVLWFNDRFIAYPLLVILLVLFAVACGY
jgi:leader peptidase (prepilin peptidase)/N-methyltransferase